MVVNNKTRKVIFIHIPKCGGVSVERTIHKALGGDDVIVYNNLIRIPPRKDVINCKGLQLHSTLKDYKRYYGLDIQDFYIFSFVRNPWRRMTSHYEYLVKDGINKRLSDYNKIDFSQFVQIYKTKMLQYTIHGYNEYLSDNYNTSINFTGKLENIDNDLKQIGDDIKLEISDVLHMNKTNPILKEHDNWRDYYNPVLKDMVYNLFKDDILRYNYEFEEV